MTMDAVKLAALKMMPPGHPSHFAITRDMDGKEREAVVWMHDQIHEGGYREWRKSYFDPVTGEYLGEA